jgi:hypothetical protein
MSSSSMRSRWSVPSSPSSRFRTRSHGAERASFCLQIDGRFFDKLEHVGRRTRQDDAPFGGIQLVLVGDFFQLPPVPTKGVMNFAFEAQSWKACVPKVCSRCPTDPLGMSIPDDALFCRSVMVDGPPLSGLPSEGRQLCEDPEPDAARMSGQDEQQDPVGTQATHRLRGRHLLGALPS